MDINILPHGKNIGNVGLALPEIYVYIHKDPDSSQGAGWQDTYRCYLGSKPSASLVKKYGKMPACYDASGKPAITPTPAPPSSNTTGGGGKVQPATNACAGLLPFGEKNTGTPSILSDIKYFQTQEMKILDSLQTEATKSSPNETLITELTANLKPYQDARMRLMAQLKKYCDANTMFSWVRQNGLTRSTNNDSFSR